MADEGKLRLVQFGQCCLGACLRRPTMLALSGPDVVSRERCRCRHSGQPPLIGRGPGGAFRIQSAQAYPSGLCRELALLHLREFCAWAAREDLAGPDAEELELAAAQEEVALGEHLPTPAAGAF